MYNDQLDQMCKVKVCVSTLQIEFFFLDITGGGKKVIISIQVFPFFVAAKIQALNKIILPPVSP